MKKFLEESQEHCIIIYLFTNLVARLFQGNTKLDFWLIIMPTESFDTL